jgi:hypothetical protein
LHALLGGLHEALEATLFKWINSRDTLAGVMPEMREA